MHQRWRRGPGDPAPAPPVPPAPTATAALGAVLRLLHRWRTQALARGVEGEGAAVGRLYGSLAALCPPGEAASAGGGMEASPGVSNLMCI